MSGTEPMIGWPTSPRCTARGCPVIFRTGPDRACPMHADQDGDTTLARMARFTALSAAPGEHGETDGDDADVAGERRTAGNGHA